MRTRPLSCFFFLLITTMQNSTNLAQNDGAEPQCMSCRKRRVKCNSSMPVCQRCGRDGIQCPGYKKQLKFIICQPSRSDHEDYEGQQYSRKLFSSGKLDRAIPEASIWPSPSNNEDELAICDSIWWYNDVFYPEFQATMPLGSRRKHLQEDVPWHLIPPMIQHMFIALLRSLHANKRGIDPLSRAEVCHYRGLTLKELSKYLPRAVEDPYGIALAAIMMLIRTDMQSSVKGNWVLHFNAARHIIIQRGGVKTCLEKMGSNWKESFVGFMLVDIFTATTCRSRLLFPNEENVGDCSKYLLVLPGLERFYLERNCACPLPIVLVITRTNLLRHKTQALGQMQEAEQVRNNKSLATELENILSSICNFDAGSWAVRILNNGRILPLRLEDTPTETCVSDLISQALRYQAAALLHLILSSERSRETSMQGYVKSAQQTLGKQLRLLFVQRKSEKDSLNHRET